MPKNVTPNHFDYAGIYVDGQRSQFRFDKPYQSSFMAGMLVPMGDPIRVFPGVKLNLKANLVIRSNTMVVPPLDPIFIDVITVWVPDRLVWSHQPQFLGDNEETAWTQTNSYSYPSVTLDTFNDTIHSILNDRSADESVAAGNILLSAHYGLYYGNALGDLPSGQVNIQVLAHRGYYAAWNYLFRDENYQRPVLFSKTDNGSDGEFGYFLRNYALAADEDTGTLIEATGEGLTAEYACLMPVNKLHDHFTSVLPEAQFGDSVSLNIGETAPLITEASAYGVGSNPIMFGSGTGALGISNGTLYAGGTAPSGSGTPLQTTNLKVDLKNATASTINQLRASVMTQRFLEALARGGRRPAEMYSSIYGVKNSKVSADYPELITRNRYMLGVNQVVATADSSGDGWTSHLGDTGAYSLTSLKDVPICEKDFTEFGYLHVFYCVRSTNRYSQSIPEHFTRQVLLDEYNPFFDHIGDVGVPAYLVNVLATSDDNFGYQEAWWFERTQTNLCCGALNKLYGSLSYWTLGEVFNGSLTTCTPSYLTFDPGVFDDVFVSSYYAYPQFLMDSKIYGVKAARMSQHSIPGIVGRI